MNKIKISDVTAMAKKKIIPISMLVEVCYTCNENCIHCCLSSHKEKGMALNQYSNLFDQMVDAGTFFVILTGGEPFTRPDFINIVEEARQRRISVTIFTNGTLINNTIVDKLRILYVQEVHISLYGSKNIIHDKITTVKGSFEKSLNAIKTLVRYGISTRIKCPLMNINYYEIDNMKKMADNLGVNIQFTNVITAKDNSDRSTHILRLTEEQTRYIIKKGDVESYSDTPVHFNDNLHCIPCDTIFNGGAIDPYGNVYPCNQWQLKGGNILITPLKKIWKESKAFNNARKIRLRHLTQCRFCELFQYCTRCPGLAEIEDGNILGCSSIAKINAQERKSLKLYPARSHIFSNWE